MGAHGTSASCLRAGSSLGLEVDAVKTFLEISIALNHAMPIEHRFPGILGRVSTAIYLAQFVG